MSTQDSLRPQFRVITGPLIGITFPIQEGFSAIGRDIDAGMHLADPAISRRHATLQRDGSRVLLTDLGSTNGTSINGQRLHGSQYLTSADLVRLGQTELVYEISQHPSTEGGKRTGRVRMGRVILLAAVVSVLGWSVTSGVTFFAGRAVALPAWLLGPAAAVAAGVVQASFQAVTGPGQETIEDRPTATRPGGASATVAIVTVLLLVGVGGYAATIGIRFGVGWLTGNEDQVGQERLASSPPPSGASGRVAATVTSIVNTTHFTRVALTVNNQEDESATLSLFHNCVLTGGSVTLQPDPFKSDWPQDVPPHSTQQGHVIFSGHLPDAATTAQFSFLHVFVFGRFGVNDSLVINSIELRPP
jgi:hypothetical protein